MLRVPNDATHDVRSAFQEMIDEIKYLQRENQKLRGSGDEQIENIRRELDALKVKVASEPSFLEPNNVFRKSGPPHAIGYVPDPGASANVVKFLREDASWQVPIAGRLVFSVGFSSGQGNVGAGETDLTSYSYMLPINELKLPGAAMILEGKLFLAANTASKILRLYVGASGNVELFSSAANVVNHQGHFRVVVRRHLYNTGLVTGFCAKDMNSAGVAPVWVFVNAGLSGIDWTTAQNIKMTAQATTTNDITMTDYGIWVFDSVAGSLV